jgi:hypothetical protein
VKPLLEDELAIFFAGWRRRMLLAGPIGISGLTGFSCQHIEPLGLAVTYSAIRV